MYSISSDNDFANSLKSSDMHVLARPVVNEFIRKYPPSSKPLRKWFDETEKADWNDYLQIRETFNTCDFIGNDRYVFNVAGNNYRLVAMVHFRIRRVYIRGVLTHAEYDEMARRGLLQNL